MELVEVQALLGNCTMLKRLKALEDLEELEVGEVLLNCLEWETAREKISQTRGEAAGLLMVSACLMSPHFTQQYL